MIGIFTHDPIVVHIVFMISYNVPVCERTVLHQVHESPVLKVSDQSQIKIILSYMIKS